MNRVLTFSGGQPLGLNNIDLIQNNVKELVNALSKANNLNEEEGVVLYGFLSDIQITNEGGSGVQIDVPEGYVYLKSNDEVCKFEADTIYPTDGYTLDDFYNDYHIAVSITFDTNVTFANSTSKNVHQYRKVYLTTTGTASTVAVKDVKSFKDLVFNYSNVDNIRNNDYVATSGLTELENVGGQSVKEFDLKDNQHIVKLDMSSNTILRRINTNDTMFDGYEIEVRIRQNEDTFAIYDLNESIGTTTGNINLNTTYNTKEVAVYRDGDTRNEDITIDGIDYTVSIRSSVIPKNKVKNLWISKNGTSINSKIEGGLYDKLDAGEKFRLKLKWDSDDAIWYEVSRIIS